MLPDDMIWIAFVWIAFGLLMGILIIIDWINNRNKP
jgi:hypothetical protein